MTKFKIYFDKDVETKWLNQMVAEGWALKSFFAGFYTFEECKKGEYIYPMSLSLDFIKRIPVHFQNGRALFFCYSNSINYFVNNRCQDRGKSRLHFYCICPFLWAAHRFSPIEPNRVSFSHSTMEFQSVSFPAILSKIPGFANL